MSVQITADSPQGKQLESAVKAQISQFDLDEDLDFVSQYIVVMVSNAKPRDEITNELSGLFGDKFNSEFTDWVFSTASSIENGQQQDDATMEDNTAETGTGTKSELPVESKSGAENGNGDHGHNGITIAQASTAYPYDNNQYRPTDHYYRRGEDQINLAGNTQNQFSPSNNFIKRGGAAISKYNNGLDRNIPRGPRSGNFRGSGGNRGGSRLGHNFSNGNFNILTDAKFGQGNGSSGEYEDNTIDFGHKPAFFERCKDWPSCQKLRCDFIHPTKACRFYPACPNALGKCTFVHIGEDTAPAQGFKFQLPPPEVAAQLKLQHEQFLEQKDHLLQLQLQQQQQPQQFHKPFGQFQKPFGQFQPAFQQQQQPSQPHIILCRYRERCSNTNCLFGHPTPANDKAEITSLEWCPNKKECADVDCNKAHPSGSLVRTPAPLPVEKSLEICKFLDRCTNPNCRFRHPWSATICRNGADCDRLDCGFTHPLKEDCKFGVNCRNYECLYQHPKGHNFVTRSVWVKDQAEQQQSQKQETSERQFAAPEDQVMETIIPEPSSGVSQSEVIQSTSN